MRSRDIVSALSTEVPAVLAEHARAWRDHPTVAAPHSAASVILLRDRAEGGLETYLLHRHSRMPFAPNMVVFPGGRVDPADEVAGPAFDALLACAVRETEEETGVLLDPAELVVWAHWITPEFEPRRYDTWFYLAVLPPDQRAADVSGETDSADWQSPADALRAADQGRIGLMPPTRSMLLELAEFSSAAAALAAGDDRMIEVVLPRLVERDGGWRFDYGMADDDLPCDDRSEPGDG